MISRLTRLMALVGLVSACFLPVATAQMEDPGPLGADIIDGTQTIEHKLVQQTYLELMDALKNTQNTGNAPQHFTDFVTEQPVDLTRSAPETGPLLSLQHIGAVPGLCKLIDPDTIACPQESFPTLPVLVRFHFKVMPNGNAVIECIGCDFQ
jgi:hypothetical protein